MEGSGFTTAETTTFTVGTASTIADYGCVSDANCNFPFGWCSETNDSCSCGFGFDGASCNNPWLFVFVLFLVGEVVILIFIGAICFAKRYKTKKGTIEVGWLTTLFELRFQQHSIKLKEWIQHSNQGKSSGAKKRTYTLSNYYENENQTKTRPNTASTYFQEMVYQTPDIPPRGSVRVNESHELDDMSSLPSEDSNVEAQI